MVRFQRSSLHRLRINDHVVAFLLGLFYRRQLIVQWQLDRRGESMSLLEYGVSSSSQRS